MVEAVIVSAVRTPIARFGGSLAKMEPYEFGAIVMKEALKRAEVDGNEVEDVVFGNCLAGGGNMARVSLLQAGLPVEVAGLTVDRQCGSGINSVALASDHVKLNEQQIYIAGGTESMTRSPYLMAPQEKPFDRLPPSFLKRRLSPESIGDPPMGITAETVADFYNISRQEQDQYALQSQMRMAHALENGFFEEQIISLHVPSQKGLTVFKEDEHPRPNSNIERLSQLKPVFKQNGTVTAGNASGVNDGAAALVVMSATQAKQRGLKPLAKIVNWVVAGVHPTMMGMGPVPAIQKLLQKTNVSLADIDLVEINEAFAAQILACNKELNIDMDKLNVNGGAIAHGHPIAATGSMLITKLCYEMQRSGAKNGIVSACVGGGQGIALLLESM
ncbi:acetyl-CoA C-acyltransferase [Shouchella sp. JSM 1781072]|uniref:thiolase family protein n=1 Tax=Shouchella sp. JSM 1781072 TaxID=3344581 RepID=UPI0035C25946